MSTALESRNSPAVIASWSDLGPSAVHEISGALTTLLADVFALCLKTQNFHWRMSGQHFRDHHLLLDEQADQIFAMTDSIADKSLPGEEKGPGPSAVDHNVMAVGGAIYRDQCPACHGIEDKGAPSLRLPRGVRDGSLERSDDGDPHGAPWRPQRWNEGRADGAGLAVLRLAARRSTCSITSEIAGAAPLHLSTPGM
ncbi:Dps family protein [Bradyrhizobium sp. 521_C7_N1_3]|uniref:Dps family protein n=1 Tax=Bradyrhizobium TaxID=374 RepID=UPI002714FAE8|nr:ferritin-like domain-containing protein [Bradyrhizobium japonicum]WLB56566.1 ferritin-like domain-containing protein [Bradyrhizobium japonicum]WLB61540.1 ferritin-like domain-containing protein [Bradyrhizobium japonicum]